jgi:hypothetical protein
MPKQRYKFIKKEIPPDGSCLFRSILCGLQYAVTKDTEQTGCQGLNSDITIQLMREMTSMWVYIMKDREINGVKVKDMIEEVCLEECDIENHLLGMTRFQGWGGQVEIVAMSFILCRSVYVYENKSFNKPLQVLNKGKTRFEDSVHILFHGDHYSTILPVKVSSVG